MQPLFIGPYDIGAQKNLKPFMLPEKAFPTLTNAFIFRGRVTRKGGYSLLGRLRRVLTSLAQDATSGAGVYFDADLLDSVRATEPDSSIQPGSVTFRIAPGLGNETIYRDNVTPGVLTYISGPYTISSGTINYSTGAVSLVFTVAPPALVATNVDLSYSPSLPVMGLLTYEKRDVNSQNQLIAFDTKYAYTISGGQFVELSPGTTWTGTDYQFFWATNYYKDATGDLFWVTNNSRTNAVAGDPIRYWNTAVWTDFAPIVHGVERLVQCLILIPYKNRLLALNTWEGVDLITSVQFPQRARWSQNGTPLDLVNGWRDDIAGRGGFFDAPTNEQIVSAGFVKDDLIVYFESSTWKLAYTGNEILPFVWQKINTELGAEATFSNVKFDNGLIAVGNVGVHVCNGVSVARIDDQIPDTVFQIFNKNQGEERTYAIRDYYKELVYFTYPEFVSESSLEIKWPNKVLVYNYRNETWSYFNESFTCYGYYQATEGIIWSDLTSSGPYPTWADWEDPWSSAAVQAFFPSIVAGNQQGFVLIINQDDMHNAETRQVQDIASSVSGTGFQFLITSTDHNLIPGSFIRFKALTATAGSTLPALLNGNIFTVLSTPTANTFTVFSQTDFTGTYMGGGVIEELSRINIKTKMFNPYWDTGQESRLVRVEYYLDRTVLGEFTCNVYTDTAVTNSMTDGSTSGTLYPGVILGNNTIGTYPEPLLPFQQFQEQIWHRQYYSVSGETFQFQFTFNDDQMMDLAINNSDWVLHGMVMHFEQGGDFQ